MCLVCAHSLARALFIVVVFTCSFRDGGGFSREAKEEETKIFSRLSLTPPNKQTNKRRIQKWYTIYKDHITLDDYEVKDGSNLELYYN